MSIWIRLLRAGVALGLVAGFLGTPVGLAHSGDVQHDPCDGMSGSSPAAYADAERLSPALTVSAHGHCFTCHWFQSLRTSFTSGPSVALGSAETSRLPETTRPIRNEFAVLRLAPRAPPSACLYRYRPLQ